MLKKVCCAPASAEAFLGVEVETTLPLPRNYVECHFISRHCCLGHCGMSSWLSRGTIKAAVRRHGKVQGLEMQMIAPRQTMDVLERLQYQLPCSLARHTSNSTYQS